MALDSRKPFVYIEFDHTGPRQPLEPDEPSQGQWLRLANNSVLPITLRVHGSPFEDLPVVQDIITPQMRMAPKSRLPDYGPMPRGYATGSDVASLLTIEPGKQIVFSVPVNHVAPGWFLQVSFQFDLPRLIAAPRSQFATRFSHGTIFPESPAGFRPPDKAVSARLRRKSERFSTRGNFGGYVVDQDLVIVSSELGTIRRSSRSP